MSNKGAFRALIILGPRFDLATDCDQALLSGSVRQHRVTDPIDAVVETLPETHRSLRPRTVDRRASALGIPASHRRSRSC